jgi:predicted amidohydrolase
MTRTVKIAAIQMDANPAPTGERLGRAERLVVKAAGAGAQLVVLPELFNVGYDYCERNYRRAELPRGPTVTWLRETASRLGIHLAGSLLLLDQDQVYNALLLFAPDGRMWRYDKLYPWGWERAYFREGRGITVADTDLGRIGMMICWDSGHPELWRRYAGRVDLMLVSSCPPDATNPTYHLPNGDQLTIGQLGPLMASIQDTGRVVFGDMLDEQTAWLRVPAVNTVGSGQLRVDVPHSTVLMLSLLPQAPWLVRYLAQSDRLQMSCSMVPGCKVVDAAGRSLAELAQEQGEAYALAEVSLADRLPSPCEPQPPSRLPVTAYLLSDVILPASCIPDYRRGLRRVWGGDMAPVDAATRIWKTALGIGLLFSFGLGMILGRRRNRG